MRDRNLQLPNSIANGLLPNRAIQTSQTDHETERNLWNKGRSLKRWRKWQPIKKWWCWSTARILVSCRYFCLPVFESHCDLGRVCNGMKVSHPSLHRARVKQLLSQLGVLLFLLSRVQPGHIQVSLIVQCPSRDKRWVVSVQLLHMHLCPTGRPWRRAWCDQ